jgi:hypothetical protein
MLRELYQHERTMQRELRERLRCCADDRYLTAALGYWLLRLGGRLVRNAGVPSTGRWVQERQLEQWRA